MRRSTLAMLYKWVTSVYLLAVVLLCVINFGSISEVPSELFGIRMDHIVHFFMFLPMPLLFFGVYVSSVSVPSLKMMAIIFILCLLLASCTELAQQYLIPWRSGEWSDLAADAAGIFSGCLVCVVCRYVGHNKAFD